MPVLPSFWLRQIGEMTPRASLQSSIEVDVAIVGGGFTGLWSARYFARLDPCLRIAVFERSYVGFGASGCNWGWVSSVFLVPFSRVARECGSALASELKSSLEATIDEVGSQVEELGIRCDFTKAGTVLLTRDRPQWRRLQADVSPATALFDARGVQRLLLASSVIGEAHEPQCASVQPAKLVCGLADRLDETGVRIYENTDVLSFGDHALVANSHTVKARSIVVETESYTAQYAEWHRLLWLLYSMMIVMAPLSDAQYASIGSPKIGLSFADERNLVVYGQITADRRIVVGWRGAPYGYGSMITTAPERGRGMRQRLECSVRELLPGLEGVGFTHFWGGTLEITRDWLPRIDVNEESGVIKVYGYAGDGIALPNLIGRLVAQLLLTRQLLLAVSKIFDRPPRSWEPEPLRCPGINAGLAMTQVVDSLEHRDIPTSIHDSLRRTLIGQVG